MRISFCPPRISIGRKQTENAYHLTRQSPEISSAANPGQSYRLDAITSVDSQLTTQSFIDERTNFNASVPFSLQQAWQMRPLIPQPPPALQRPLIPPLELVPYITLPGFPGFVDKYGIYRDWEKENFCGRGAYRTVGYALGKKLITDERYEKKVPDQVAKRKNLVEFADEDGLDTRTYHTKQFGGSSIPKIDDTNVFVIIIVQPGDYDHGITMVRTREGFRPSSGHPERDKCEIYPGTATEAFLAYQKWHNVAACAAMTFRDAHGLNFNSDECFNKGLELSQSGDWEKAIEKYDEVITRLWEEDEPAPRNLVAKALYSKGNALSQSNLWKEAIEAYQALETCFGKELASSKDPELRKIIANGHRYKNFALTQQPS